MGRPWLPLTTLRSSVGKRYTERHALRYQIALLHDRLPSNEATIYGGQA